MPSTEEQRLEVIENCNLLLERLRGCDTTDDTPEGRIIAQCKWFKERAENYDLPLPVAPEYTGSLRYIYTNGDISHLETDREYYYWNYDVPMQRLIALCYEGELLFKADYFRFLPICIDRLMQRVNAKGAAMHPLEKGLLENLSLLKTMIAKKQIKFPRGGMMPEFKKMANYRFGYEFDDDTKKEKKLNYAISNMVFRGVRPSEWLTPEDAERACVNY